MTVFDELHELHRLLDDLDGREIHLYAGPTATGRGTRERSRQGEAERNAQLERRRRIVRER